MADGATTKIFVAITGLMFLSFLLFTVNPVQKEYTEFNETVQKIQNVVVPEPADMDYTLIDMPIAFTVPIVNFSVSTRITIKLPLLGYLKTILTTIIDLTIRDPYLLLKSVFTDGNSNYIVSATLTSLFLLILVLWTLIGIADYAHGAI